MPVPKDEVLELMRMEVDPAEVDEIRELWKAHSKAEDNRSIEGLLATLSEDCVYTVYPDDVSWHGHEGAARFYTELLTAFPDIVFELQNIVIGPQGVVEEAIVTGTHRAKWLDNEPTGETMTWRNAIFFPWDPNRAASRASASTRTCRGGPPDGPTPSPPSTSSATGPGFRKVRQALGVTPSASTASSTRRGTPASATTTTRRTSSTSSTAAPRGSRSTARNGSSAPAASSTSSRRRRAGSRTSARTSSCSSLSAARAATSSGTAT